jgi:hypothetical protein
MDDLWEDASEDFARLRRQAAMARADAELEGVMPFLLASLSPQEYDHRESAAWPALSVIAAACDLDVTELAETARRRYRLYREALAEGADVMQQLERNLDGSGYGSGPERPSGHSEGPDFSGGYSEVPAGPPGGPDPAVTRPRVPSAGPVQEATGSRRHADAGAAGMGGQPYTPQLPPDTGTGRGSLDTGTPSAAAGGMTPSLPAGVNGSGDTTTPLPNSSIGQVTSSADPVRRRVMAVTAAIEATNPQLPREECERVARQVVGRYFQADLAGSVMNDEPVNSGGGSGGQGSSGGSGGGIGQHMLEWKGLKSMMPGGGAAGAGEAAGGAGEIAEMAPLLAL